MGSLPDEIWVQILQSGVRNGQFQHRDLCALAIVSRRMNDISGLDFVWKQLLVLEFPEKAVDDDDASFGQLGSEASWKKLYKLSFEKVKRKKIAAHKRKLLRVASSLNVLQKESHHFQRLLRHERDRLSSCQKELANFDRISSRASVALQIWQPQAVTTRHEQVLQQMPVDVLARKNSLLMEIEYCKLRIHCMERTLNFRKDLIDEQQKELDALTYNPSHDLTCNKDLTDSKVVLVKNSRKRERQK